MTLERKRPHTNRRNKADNDSDLSILKGAGLKAGKRGVSPDTMETAAEKFNTSVSDETKVILEVMCETCPGSFRICGSGYRGHR